MGLGETEVNLPLSLEYARREARRLEPVILNKEEAPAKAVIRTEVKSILASFL